MVCVSPCSAPSVVRKLWAASEAAPSPRLPRDRSSSRADSRAQSRVTDAASATSHSPGVRPATLRRGADDGGGDCPTCSNSRW